MNDPACVFCRRIGHGEYDDTAVVGVVSFVPLGPVTPGHRLFLPRDHIESAIHSPIHAALAVKAAAIYMQEHPEAAQANIITSIGPNATQTIRHLHVHLVPRRPEDGLVLPWTNQK